MVSDLGEPREGLFFGPEADVLCTGVLFEGLCGVFGMDGLTQSVGDMGACGEVATRRKARRRVRRKAGERPLADELGDGSFPESEGEVLFVFLESVAEGAVGGVGKDIGERECSGDL